jgi:DNA-binding IclR family transcriptional regulator
VNSFEPSGFDSLDVFILRMAGRTVQTLASLCAASGVKEANVTARVVRLSELGLVERAGSRAWRLTPQGLRLLGRPPLPSIEEGTS